MKERNEELMITINEDRYKHKGKRKCSRCGNSKGLIRKYELYVCRRCFREVGREIGFDKFH